MKGDAAVEERGPRGNDPREAGSHDGPAGLVPVFPGDERGVEERPICHGAGDERRITV